MTASLNVPTIDSKVTETTNSLSTIDSMTSTACNLSTAAASKMTSTSSSSSSIVSKVSPSACNLSSTASKVTSTSVKLSATASTVTDPNPYIDSVNVKEVTVIDSSSTELPLIKFECDYCSKTFSVKQSMLRHVRECHLNNLVKFIFKSCNIDFRRLENLNRHIMSNNCFLPDELTFECKKCKKLFNTQDKLENHELHNCPKKYFCNLCLQFFKKKNDFLSHDHFL